MKKCVLIPAVLLAASVGVAGCGEDGGDGKAAGNGADRAFARAMVPHHEMAVEMAELARERAEHAEIRRLAGDMIATQTAEIKTLRRLDGQLATDGVEVGDLGVPEHMRGMDADMRMLERAKRFDRSFIAMMVPHHEGAIAMARAELDDGEHPGLRRIATAIIDAQRREIDQMREWSNRWYGTAPPGNGSMPHMDH